MGSSFLAEPIVRIKNLIELKTKDTFNKSPKKFQLVP